MKKNLLLLNLVFTSVALNAQSIYVRQNNAVEESTSNFFSDVRYGGNIGLNFGNGFTNINIAPSAIKPINQFVSLGAGLQYNYLSSKDFYSSSAIGYNLIGLFNPVPNIQLSVELEQLYVNYSEDAYYDPYYGEIDGYENSFWNTGLFIGGGYTSGNATFGIRYNVLFKDGNSVYNEAWMPFIRVYF